MKTLDDIQSIVIKQLRFPLMVAVIFIHSDLLNFKFGLAAVPNNISWFPIIFNLISGGICRIAVPLFFFISGYLFFYNTNSEGSSINYWKKIHRRIYTLVIPYLLWNTLYLIIFAIGQGVFPSLLSGNNKLIANYSFLDFIQCYWNIIGGLFPINGPLWYLRDLIIISFLSPVIYWLLRQSRGVIIIILFFLWLFNIGSVGSWGVIRIDGFLFYILGAWLSIKQLPIAFNMRKEIMYLVLLLFSFCLIGNFYSPIFIKGIVILGIFLIPSLVLCIQKKYKTNVNRLLLHSNFFIYAFHSIPLTLFGKLIVKNNFFTSDWQFMLLYFTLPFFIILLGLFMFRLLEYIAPRHLNLLIGKR